MTFFILSVEHKKQLGRKLRNDSLGNLNDDILIFLSETRNRLRLVSYCFCFWARERVQVSSVYTRLLKIS